MRLSDAAKLAGISPKSARRYIEAGLVPGPNGEGPAKIRRRNGLEYDLSDADASALRQAAAATRSEKATRNSSHRSEVLATNSAQERRAGGKTGLRVVKALGQGESAASVVRTIARTGPELLTDRWLLLITVYQTMYGTCNPVELRAQSAVSPATIERAARLVRQEAARETETPPADQ